jgi:hypothetical protein
MLSAALQISPAASPISLTHRRNPQLQATAAAVVVVEAALVPVPVRGVPAPALAEVVRLLVEVQD